MTIRGAEDSPANGSVIESVGVAGVVAGAVSAPTAQAPAGHTHRALRAFRRVGAVFGPGLITGAADDDPSGIATYVQSGAQFGYALLWMALFVLPLMTAV